MDQINSIFPVFVKAAFQLSIPALFYVVFVCIYRVTFHPLAKYPGPFLAKFTNAYAGYHAWKGDLHLDLWRCHERYGDFVRYAPNTLNTNTVTGLNDIYSSGRNVSKGKQYQAMVHQALNTLTITDKKEHSRRRRVVSQGFSDSVIRSYGPSMIALINKLCDCLVQDTKEGENCASDEWKPARDLSKWCNYLSFDIMTDLIFGRAYDLLGKNTYRYVTEAIEHSNVRVSVLIQVPSLKFCRLDKVLFPKAIAGRNLFIRFVGKLLKDTFKITGASRKDFFAVLSTIKDPQTGLGLRKEEIVAESTTLVVAGADTVATAMTSVLFYLSRHPAAYARAVNEVRNTFQDVQEVQQGSRLSSCTYLRACIDESMRMSPSVGCALSREVQAGGAVIDGEFIPAGCIVGTPIYSIHHNNVYFPDPFKFSPERWIVGEGQTTRESVDLALKAYMPFSSGPRSCLGKGMALTELLLTMATILWRLDFKVAEGDRSGGHSSAELGRHRPWEFQLRDHVTSANSGPVLHFRERRV